MSAATEKEHRYYLGWVDRRTDPWPNHERLHPGTADGQLDGHPVEFLAPDHKEWPGLPVVRGVDPPVTADGRMGRYSWPGIPLADHARVYAGPSVAALLHPRSPARLKLLRRAYLLYQPDAPGSPHDRLAEVLFAAARSRGIAEPRDRVVLVPIPGITDPTDFKQITDAVGQWLRLRERFGPAGKAKRVFVNLSPGTTAMAASWLILYWSGALDGTRVAVEFVQGDGGLDGTDTPDNPSHRPLRTVPVNVLALVKEVPEAPASPAADRATVPDEVVPIVPDVATLTVDTEQLAARPTDRALRNLEQAAAVGMPVVLLGERGTGKTSLAEHYHKRRQYYRWGPAGCPPPFPGLNPKVATGTGRRDPVGPPWRPAARKVVKATLSEFGELNNLKGTLFGWMRLSFAGAGPEDNDGLLGEAHEGTLFLDEIHHLPREFQKLLLAPLNFDSDGRRTYLPENGYYQVQSDFDLVSATNDPRWRERLREDLVDRIGKIVIEVPPLRAYQESASDVLWQGFEKTLAALCKPRKIEDPKDDLVRIKCARRIDEFLRTDPLPGNWRDLQTLAAYVLYLMNDARTGRPAGRLRWSEEQTDEAIRMARENRPPAPPESCP